MNIAYGDLRLKPKVTLAEKLMRYCTHYNEDYQK